MSTKLDQIKQEIQSGTYETDEKLTIAVARLLPHVVDDDPELPPGFACNDWDGLS